MIVFITFHPFIQWVIVEYLLCDKHNILSLFLNVAIFLSDKSEHSLSTETKYYLFLYPPELGTEFDSLLHQLCPPRLSVKMVFFKKGLYSFLWIPTSPYRLLKYYL